jgi:phage-related minor tail protein
MAVNEIRVRIGLEGAQNVQAGAGAAGAALEKLGTQAGKAGTATGLAGYQSAQLSAQLQDLFVQIQAGGSPLTALIQQGSQLSAVFGGTGNALKAVAAIIPPTGATIGAAAGVLGALAYGYAKGNEESAAFTRAVVLSGNAAGVSAGQLSDMAAAVARLGGGTQGRAAEILTQMASAGQVGAVNLTRFTDAALKLEQYGGGAASDTAKAFEDLGRAPVEASRKLDASTNAFTESVLRQIKVLDQQGRAAEAANLAQTSYADALDTRIPKLAIHVGTLEKAWMGVKSATADTLDVLLNIGREETAQQKLDKLEATLTRLRGLKPQDGAPLSVGAMLASQSGQMSDAREASLQKQVDAQRALVNGESEQAKAQREINQAKQAGLRFDDQAEQYLSRQAKYSREVTQATVEGLAAGRSMADIQARVAQIQSKYDPGTTLQAVKGAEARKLEILKQSQNQIDTLYATGSINEIEYIKRTTQVTVDSYDARISAAGKELGILRSKQDTELAQAQKRDEIDQLTLQRQGAKQAGINQTTVAIYRQTEAAEALQRAFDATDKAQIEEMTRQANSTMKSISDSFKANTQSIEDSNELLRLEVQLQGVSNEQRDAEIAKLRIKQQLIATTKQIEGLTAFISTDEKQLLLNNEVTSAAAATSLVAARASVAQWKRASDEINSTLTDSLLKAFDDGKGAAQDMVDAIKAIFRNLILKPVIQAVFQPASSAIANYITGSSAGSSAGNAFNQAASGASLANSMYSAGGGTGLAGTALSAANYGAVYTGSAYSTAFGSQQSAMLAAQESGMVSGAGSSALGSAGTYAAYAALAYAAAVRAQQDYANGFNAQSSKNVFQSATGTSFAGAEGVKYDIAKALGVNDKWASILSGSTAVAALFGYGNTQVEGRNIVGNVSSSGFDGTLDVRSRQQGGLFRSDRVSTTSNAISGDIDRALDDATAKIRETAKKYGAALSLPVDQIDQVTKAINIDVTFATDAEIAQKIQDEMTSYGNSLLEGFSAALDPVKNVGETVSQTIERVAGSLLQVNDIFGTLGLKLLSTSVDGGKAAVALSNAFGGLDQLGQSAGSYYANYYSDAEKAAQSTKALTQALGGVGLALPATRDGFRALVEGLDLTTESGQKQFQVLLGVQAAFADLTPAAQASATALRSAADILKERASLEGQLLQLQGNTTELRNRERAALDDSNRALYDSIKALEDKQAADQIAAQKATAVAGERSTLEGQLLQLQGNTAELRARERVALDDTNRALYDSIAALQDKQAADQIEAQRQAAVTGERVNLETQLLQLQGDSTTLRARERAALDDSNRTLYDQIQALTDQQAAAAKAAAALTAFSGTLANLGNTRFDLESQVLTLQGNGAEVLRRTRERDLAELTKGLSTEDAARVTAAYDYNNTLRDQVTALTTAKAAADALAQAQAQAAADSQRAADALKQAWQGATDNIFQEVARIRGLTAGTTPQSLAQAQTAFTIANAQAAAGDQGAAALLPQLSRALLDLAQNQAGSLLELQRLRAMTAASLQGTGTSLAGLYGLTIPKLATGTNRVPQDMLALLHAGEAVVPVPFNPALAGGPGVSDAGVQALVNEIAELRSDQRAQATAMSQLLTRLAKLQERWDLDGMPEVRSTV